MRRCHVADKDVVLGLLAVPFDDGTLAVHDRVQEGGDHVLTGGDVARTVDVAVAEDGVGETGLGAEHAHVVLARDFGHAIGADGIQRMGLRNGLHARVPIDRATGRREDDLAAGHARSSAQDTEGSQHVDLGISLGIRHRAGNQRLSGEMQHGRRLDEVEDAVDRRLITHVRFEELGPGVEVRPGSRRQVVDDSDLMAGPEKGVDHVRSDEARSAGDQGAHQ